MIARLGVAGPGRRLILALRFTDGATVDVDGLPASERWVLRTVTAFLAEDVAEGAVAHHRRTIRPHLRAETLADEIIWLAS
nr:hypothetical protein [Rhodococcus wratislaviensis]GLK41231.1 hypothetical protein GCM10017611_81070 [Rhodococcus wratislaviensis]